MPTIEKDRSKWSLMGAILAALAASVCCLGPLLLLAIGLGGAWAGNLPALAPYRPIFMALSAGFLAFAFYRIYRKPAQDECEPGSACANPKSNRTNKIGLWIVTALILGLFAFPYLMPHLTAKSKQTDNQITQQVTLQIKGMTCAGCIATVQKSLTDISGVVNAKVTLDPPRAVVTYDTTKAAIKDLTTATANAGYPSAVQ